MSFSWKQYEGQVINNTFPLQKYLGGSGESAVFLTHLAGPQSSKAALKLVPEGPSPDLQLSLWRRASKLTHPNLLQLYQGGRCRLADMDLLYVIMEYAEEDLSQILPQRALTPAEARDMLGPVLDALGDLHAQGLVHSHLRPSNVLATADQVKLSTDRLFPAGEIRKSTAKRTVYDAPETADQALTPASDVWSLGVMLIEVLTQHRPEAHLGEQSLPAVPHSISQPFQDIAQHALLRDPHVRWTIANVAASLNPRAAAAAQSASPLSVPLSPVPAIPAAKLQPPKPAPPAPILPPPAPIAPPAAKAPRPAPQMQPAPMIPPLPTLASAPPPQPMQAGAPKRDIVLPSYVIPLAVAAVVVAAIIALPKFLSKGVESSAPSTSTKARAVAPGPEEKPASSEVARNAKPNSSSSSRDALKSSPAKPAAKESPQPAAKETSQPAAAAPSPASLRTETKPAADASSSAASSSATGSGKGEVLDQILPDVPEKALATISGKVRVSVRAHVDAAGNVSSAEFESPGPSKYFADAALKAVRRWEFTSPEAAGRSVPSEWLVRFEFTPSGVKAFPQQITP
jgi:protein TonB